MMDTSAGGGGGAKPTPHCRTTPKKGGANCGYMTQTISEPRPERGVLKKLLQSAEGGGPGVGKGRVGSGPTRNPRPYSPGMHWNGRDLRGSPRSPQMGGWRRLPKQLGAVIVG